MSAIPEIRRREPCDTCAYRKGTQANLSWNTQLKAKLCVETATVFLCHEDQPAEVLCAGWSSAITTRFEAGALDQPAWRQALYKELLEIIDDIEAHPESYKDAECHERINDRIRVVMATLDESPTKAGAKRGAR